MVESARETRLREFVTWAARLAGDEKGEAQVFLDRLLQGFGHGGVKEAGAVLEKRIKSRDRKGTAFADLVWKPYVLIEMKKRGEDLARHYRDAPGSVRTPCSRPTCSHATVPVSGNGQQEEPS